MSLCFTLHFTMNSVKPGINVSLNVVICFPPKYQLLLRSYTQLPYWGTSDTYYLLTEKSLFFGKAVGRENVGRHAFLLFKLQLAQFTFSQHLQVFHSAQQPFVWIDQPTSITEDRLNRTNSALNGLFLKHLVHLELFISLIITLFVFLPEASRQI